MSSDSYKPGQKIRVRHKDALGQVTVHDGEIIEHVKDHVWRVTFGGFGLRFLIPETEISDAEQSSHVEVEGGQAPQRVEEGA